jgi:hypothetical protein
LCNANECDVVISADLASCTRFPDSPSLTNHSSRETLLFFIRTRRRHSEGRRRRLVVRKRGDLTISLSPLDHAANNRPVVPSPPQSRIERKLREKKPDIDQTRSLAFRQTCMWGNGSHHIINNGEGADDRRPGLGGGGHRRHACLIVYMTKSFNYNIESLLQLIFRFPSESFRGFER